MSSKNWINLQSTRSRTSSLVSFDFVLITLYLFVLSLSKCACLLSGWLLTFLFLLLFARQPETRKKNAKENSDLNKPWTRYETSAADDQHDLE